MYFKLVHVFIYSFLWIVIVFTNQLQEAVTVIPENACPGESVTVECKLIPPNPGDTFVSIEIRFIVGSSNSSLSETDVDSGSGDPLNRLTATVDFGSSNSTFLVGSLTLSSFTSSDNGLRVGCAGRYTPSGGGAAIDLIDTENLRAADPPLPPTLTVSLTSLDPASCSGSVSIAWTPGDSDRSVDTYFLFLNGDLINTLSSSINTYSYSISIILDTNYTYSITANSCAGNSTQPNQDTIYIDSSSLINSGPSSLFLSYVQSAGTLTVFWGLTPISRDLTISYSLQINYTHSQYDNISNFYRPTSFSLLSNTSIRMVSLIPNSFTTSDGVVTNITACISITSQCGITFSGETLCGFYNSANPPTTTQPVSPTINEITDSTNTTTNATTSTLPTSAPFPIAIVVGAVGGGAAVLLILILILFLIMLCICCGKKSGDIKEIAPPISSNPTEPTNPIAPTNPMELAMYTPMYNLPTKQPVYANI